MNIRTIKNTTTKAKTSIDFVEEAFGFEPFTRKDYESRLDRVASRWYNKHHEHFTIETLLKYDIIKIVRVETFKRVEIDNWSGFVMDNCNNKIISSELWENLSSELRKQIMSVVEDTAPISVMKQRDFTMPTQVLISILLSAILKKRHLWNSVRLSVMQGDLCKGLSLYTLARARCAYCTKKYLFFVQYFA
jgi:hypothetical protein